MLLFCTKFSLSLLFSLTLSSSEHSNFKKKNKQHNHRWLSRCNLSQGVYGHRLIPENSLNVQNNQWLRRFWFQFRKGKKNFLRSRQHQLQQSEQATKWMKRTAIVIIENVTNFHATQPKPYFLWMIWSDNSFDGIAFKSILPNWILLASHYWCGNVNFKWAWPFAPSLCHFIRNWRLQPFQKDSGK